MTTDDRPPGAAWREHPADSRASGRRGPRLAERPAAYEGTCLLDREGHVEPPDGGAPQLPGFPLLVRNCLDLLRVEAGGSDEPLAALCHARQRLEQELFVAGRWYRVAADPRLESSGACRGAVLFWRDITEHHCPAGDAGEAADSAGGPGGAAPDAVPGPADETDRAAWLRHAQKLQTLGRLAGGVVHDFNNLLTVINGRAAEVELALGPDSPHRQALAEIRQTVNLAARLARQVLEFGRPQAFRARPLDLNALVADLLTFLDRAFKSRVALTLRPGDDLPAVSGDPDQLRQVVLNLCLNARDAMPEGGTLTLTTEAVHVAAADHAAPGGYVRLRVEDTGVGMTPGVIARIFEPFYTTKPPGEGTGLGLALVQDIVGRHGGWVECHSTPGRGTCFDVYLQAAPPAPPAAAPARAGPATVLVADDDPAICSLVRAVLERAGHRVLTAEDGRAAVELFLSEFGRIDLALLDHSMPRLNGLEALREMAAAAPGVRAILTSGYPAESLSAEEHAGLAGFLGKPFAGDQLLRLVERTLAPSPALGGVSA